MKIEAVKYFLKNSKIVLEYWNEINHKDRDLANKVLLLKSFILNNTYMGLLVRSLGFKEVKKYQLVEKISDINCSAKLLYSMQDRENYISKPNIYPYDRDHFECLEGNSPDINIWMIEDCSVYSKSSSIIGSTRVYNHSYFNIQAKHDLKTPISQGLDSYFNKNLILRIMEISDDGKETIYIHLLNEHSQNYYHWLFEIMPKFITIFEMIATDEELKTRKYTLLLDDDLPEQFYEILGFYATVDYDIRVVKKFELVMHCKIIYCTDFWTSLDNTRHTPNIIEEFFVDRHGVSLIKTKLLGCPLPSAKPTRKIYFERTASQARALYNADELKRVLVKEGFEVVSAEKLSFREQIDLLHEAKIIIGVSGAVFSNIIFMQPQTNAIVLSPQTIAANYYIFQPMADIAEVNLIHILVDNDTVDESIHAPASININEVYTVLKSLKE